MPSGTKACRSGFAWFLALAAGTLACHAGAAEPVQETQARIRVTAQTPTDPDALSAADFAAIVAEARKVPVGVPPDGHIALPDAWHSLTREKLAAMLAMPRFGKIPRQVRQVLVDQAATWDLFDFKRPSDAAALWGRIWSARVEGRPAHFFFEYTPDGTWSPTSLAMASVFVCFPREAWTSTQPVVAAVDGNLGWAWNMGHGGARMRDCLPDVGEPFVHWTPTLLAKVSGILVRKFTHELQEDGCTRSGPDSCLVIFQALYGLAPHDPELPALLGKMQSSFLDNDVPWWQSARNDSTPAKVADVMHPRLVQRMAFLTAKLPVVIDDPAAWPARELENTLAQAFRTSTRLEQLQGLSYTRYNYQNFDRDLIDPVHWLTGKRGREAAPALRTLAGAYAQMQGCALPPIAQDRPIAHSGMAAFKRAHAIANIHRGNGNCGEVAYLDLPGLVTASPARQRQLMAEFQPIASQLAKGGSLHEQALDLVADACHEEHPAGRDPFGLCADAQARDAARRAAALAEMPQVDPLECPENLLAHTEQALSITPEGYDFAACRKSPADTSQAIVALAYHSGDGDRQDDNGEDDYDLDLAIVDIDSGRILAHRHDANGIESDAVSLGRVWLDTARYDLAPGRRAFGVRTRNDAHCWQCAYGYTKLSLYLRDGSELRKILTTTVEETLTDEGGNVVYTTTVLCVGKNRHHGLADLWASSVSTPDYDGENAAHMACGPDAPDHALWRYDGTRYVAAKNAH